MLTIPANGVAQTTLAGYCKRIGNRLNMRATTRWMPYRAPRATTDLAPFVLSALDGATWMALVFATASNLRAACSPWHTSTPSSDCKTSCGRGYCVAIELEDRRFQLSAGARRGFARAVKWAPLHQTTTYEHKGTKAAGASTRELGRDQRQDRQLSPRCFRHLERHPP